MLDRVVTDVIDVHFQVLLVADPVLPEAAFLVFAARMIVAVRDVPSGTESGIPEPLKAIAGK